MKITPGTWLGSALVVLLGAAGSAHAEAISWSYNWSRNPAEVLADAPGSGKITLTDEAKSNVTGDSDIVATNLHTVSSATPEHPDLFTNAAYTLDLQIIDTDSGQSGTVVFHGVFNGTLTATSAHIQNTFLGAVTQVLILGNHMYTTTLGPYSQPGPPTATQVGSISAHTSVTLIQTVPEPGTLLLSLLGAVTLGATRYRRRW
jgi:hypothetical protein